MKRELYYEEILNSNKNYIYVDVRSPIEFEEDTIPGAINIPIFSNLEREIVGTVYKEKGKDEAKRLAISFTASKLTNIYDKFEKLQDKNIPIVIFCARGGNRSSSIFALLYSLGFNVYKIKNGYKDYRNYINNNLKEIIDEINFITLFGKTGTGKTKILKELKEKGYEILDLEGAAKHRGSLLGSVGIGKQNSQKMFESILFDTLRNRKSNLIFTEGESKRIGNVIMKDYIYDSLQNSIKVLVDAPINTRINYIRNDYIENVQKKDLIENILKLSKYISKERIDKYIIDIKNNNENIVIEDLMIKYYDLNYSLANKSFEYNIYNDNEINTINKLIDIYNENSFKISEI